MALTLARQMLLQGVTEKHFRQVVKEWAEQRGWEVYFTWNSIHSPAGFPDLVLVRPPRIVFAELKRQNGKATPRQDFWLDLLRHVPCTETYLWRPLDEALILAVLA